MPIKRVQKKINWTPEDLAQHRTIREKFKGKPSIEELIDQGELSGQPMPLGTYLDLRLMVRSLRNMREEAGLSLGDLAKRSGMDKAMLSRLETGHVPNPGIETIARYVAALDKIIEWRLVDVPEGKRNGAGVRQG